MGELQRENMLLQKRVLILDLANENTELRAKIQTLESGEGKLSHFASWENSALESWTDANIDKIVDIIASFPINQKGKDGKIKGWQLLMDKVSDQIKNHINAMEPKPSTTE